MISQRSLLFYICLIYIFLAGIDPLFPLQVYLKEYLEYSGNILTLKDIASLKDEDDKVTKELLSLSLPLNPNRLHIISSYTIRNLIEKSFTGPLIIVGKSVTCVPIQAIPKDSSWYFKELLAFLNENDWHSRLEIEIVAPPDIDYLSQSEYIRFKLLNFNRSNGYLSGNMEIQYDIFNSFKNDSGIISLILHCYLNTAVPLNRIYKGERLSKSQLVFLENDMAEYTQDILLADMPCDRYVAMDDLRPNESIPLKKLRTDYIIKTGDHIKIIFIQAGIQIEMKGRSLQSGYTGSLISVQPFGSAKKFDGIIMNNKGVVVELN